MIRVNKWVELPWDFTLESAVHCIMLLERKQQCEKVLLPPLGEMCSSSAPWMCSCCSLTEDFADLSNSEIVCWYDMKRIKQSRRQGRQAERRPTSDINTGLILQPKPVMETDCLHTYVFWFCSRRKAQSANNEHWPPWRKINGKYTRGGEVTVAPNMDFIQTQRWGWPRKAPFHCCWSVCAGHPCLQLIGEHQQPTAEY